MPHGARWYFFGDPSPPLKQGSYPRLRSPPGRRPTDSQRKPHPPRLLAVGSPNAALPEPRPTSPIQRKLRTSTERRRRYRRACRGRWTPLLQEGFEPLSWPLPRLTHHNSFLALTFSLTVARCQHLALVRSSPGHKSAQRPQTKARPKHTHKHGHLRPANTDVDAHPSSITRILTQ